MKRKLFTLSGCFLIIISITAFTNIEKTENLDEQKREPKNLQILPKDKRIS